MRVDIKGNNKQLKKSLNDSKKSIGGFSNAVKTAGKALIGAFAIKSVIVGIKNMATELGKTADRLLDLEQITGLSTDKLQEYEHVARIAGVNSEFYARAVEGLTQRLARGAEMSSTLRSGFESLGIAMHDSAGNLRDGSEVTEEVITQLAGMNDITRRNVIGAQIFSGAWKELAPVLALGSDGIEQAKQEARELGLVMDKEALASANEMRIEMETLNAQWKQMRFDIMQEAVPALQFLVRGMKNSIEGFKIMIGLQDRMDSVFGTSEEEAKGIISSMSEVTDMEEFRAKLVQETIFYQNKSRELLNSEDEELQKIGNRYKEIGDYLRENYQTIVDNKQNQIEAAEAAAKAEEIAAKEAAEAQKQELGDIGRLQEQIKQAEANYITANSDAERSAALQQIELLKRQLELIEAKARVQAQGTQGTQLPGVMPSIGVAPIQTEGANMDVLANQIQGVGAAAEQTQDKINNLSESMVNWQQLGVNAAMNIGSALGQVASDSDSSTQDVLKNTFKQIVAMLVQQIVATVPFPASLAVAAGAGAMTSLLVPGFATGGEIPAGYPNDSFVAGLTSGEKVLNPSETAAYNEWIRSGGMGNGGGEVKFRISGQELVGVLNRHINRINENS